jgi:hypothetical protein
MIVNITTFTLIHPPISLMAIAAFRRFRTQPEMSERGVRVPAAVPNR